MTTPWTPPRRALRAYALAALLAGGALAVRWLLDPLLDGTAPYLPFVVATALAAWRGGLGPGLLATALGGLAGASAFVAPRGELAGIRPEDAAHLALFLGTGAFVAWLVDHVQRLDHGLRLRARLCDHAHDAIFAHGTDGVVRYWNEGAERLYGWPRAEAEGRELRQLFGEPPEAASAEVRHALDAVGAWRGERTRRARDGRTLLVESRVARLPAGEDGTLVLQADRDLSARRRAELELEEQSLRYRIALDGAGLHFWEIDLESRRVNAAPGAFEAHGMAGVEHAALDEAFAHVHPDDLARVESAVSRAMAGDGDYHETYRVLRAGSEPRWLYAAGRVVDYLGPGRPRGRRLLGFLQDVTVARQAEAELRSREAQLRLLADSIPQLAWMARPDGHIFWFNRRWYEYTGCGWDETEGWGWQKVHDPFELPRVVAGYREALASGRPWEDTFPLRRHDGEMRWHLSRALPLREPDGRIALWFGTNTDITERLQMEEALRSADRRKDEFLATLAHELRNPLAPLGNGLQLLSRDDLPRERAVEVGSMMVRQLARMVRLIDDLLDASRITRGRIELKRAPTTLRAVLEAAHETVHPALDAAGLRVEWALPPAGVPLDADVTRLAQAFANVLGNAAKYTPAGGLVRIEAEVDGPRVAVRVVDTGAGIPRGSLERVFELFAQVRTHQDEAPGGLGIGLPLARALVELHDGTIRAESEGPGRGTTIVVGLPVARALADAAGAEGAPPVAASPPARRALVADDNVDAAQSLAMLLQLEGCAVRVVHDGEAAVRVAEEFRPDVVFMDVGMPLLDGLDATRRIRRLPWGREPRIHALTGWGQEADRERSREAGMDRHLVKPIDPAVLGELLAELGVARPTADPTARDRGRDGTTLAPPRVPPTEDTRMADRDRDRDRDGGRDMNRDPVTGQPGSHPVGTGVGAAGGALAGAAAGAFLGPIGLLVGTAIGAIAGGATGNAIAESVDPTEEEGYWREHHRSRDYVKADHDYDRDYAPAYRYGVESRNRHADRTWDSSLETDLKGDWERTRGDSRLQWEDARPAIRDSWDRTDRTYRTYQGADTYWRDRYSSQSYYEKDYSYDDYRPAYRYGTYARSTHAGRDWNDDLERDLESGWDKFRGDSKLTWAKAKAAVRDGWHSVERSDR